MKKIKKYIYLILILLSVIGFLKIFLFTPTNFTAFVDNDILFNDNNSYSLIKLIPYSRLGVKVPLLNFSSDIKIIEGRELVDIIYQNNEKSEIRIKSKLLPGKVKIIFNNERLDFPVEIKLIISENYADSDNDGYYDVNELKTENDRNNFRKWFVNIALSQFYKESRLWNENEKDCAGLLRFAYREALKKHNDDWHSKFGFLLIRNIDDVKKYNYPDIPIIGTNLFLVNDGIRKYFSNFADSKNLINNVVFFYQKI